MAKFAFVRYGSDGEGPKSKGGALKSYTYVVNDNVRKGDRISPVVKHAKSGTIYATTGKVMATAANENTQNGKQMMEQVKEKEEETKQPITLTNVYSGKELGLASQQGEGGKFVSEGGGSFSTRNNGYVLGQREKATRGGNVSEYIMQHGGTGKLSSAAKSSIETFESYSKAFLPTGKEWRG